MSPVQSSEAAGVLTEAEAVALTLDYLSELSRLGEMVGEAIAEVFRNMDAYEREQLVDYLEQVRPLAHAGASEGADLAGAYLTELTGSAPPAIKLDLESAIGSLEGPFHRMWHNLGEGQSYEQARDAGESMARMDGTDTPRGGAGQRLAEPGIHVIGYRRPLHPGACEWCQVVATQLYKSMQSAYFGHHGCQCRPAIPVTDTHDPALAINRKLLKSLRKSGAVERVSAARERSRSRGRGRR